MQMIRSDLVVDTTPPRATPISQDEALTGNLYQTTSSYAHVRDGSSIYIVFSRGRKVSRIVKARVIASFVYDISSTATDSRVCHIADEIASIKLETDGDISSPTSYSEKLVTDVIEEAYRYAAIPLPRPSIVPDEMGGLIVEWKSGYRVTRLIAPADKSRKAYIYTKDDHPSAITYNVTGEELATCLKSVFPL
jgi:hypothetical protein